MVTSRILALFVLGALASACGSSDAGNGPAPEAGASGGAGSMANGASGSSGNAVPEGGGGTNADVTEAIDSGRSADSNSADSGGSSDGGLAPVGKVLLFENFDQATLPTSLGVGSQAGGAVELSSDPEQTYGGTGKSLRGTYPLASGGVYAWGLLDIAKEQTRDIWVRFRARMPSTSPQGLKFLKVFGGNDGGYANTTFGLDYTGVERGGMYCASFGDGTNTQNDTANIILFDGSNPSLVGRAFGKPGYSALTPQKSFWRASEWGKTWHLFELHVKFNSGTTTQTEVNDGEIFVRIDGKVYLDAKGVYNRHPSNPPIERVEILGWAQSGTTPFELWYDNIEIAVGGFGSSPV